MHLPTFYSTLCKRLSYGRRFAQIHLFASLFIASLAALLVFTLWFPYPYRQLAGGRDLFFLIIFVDVVCGPVLTLVLAAPQKLRKELLADIGLVVLIQLAALGYGLYTLSLARPVALVFEVDRFRVVTAADINTDELAKASEPYNRLPLTGPRLLGIRSPSNSDESMEAIEYGLAGVEPSMRPHWWSDYQPSVQTVMTKALPIAQLRAKHPDQSSQIDRAIEESKLPEQALVWLPLVSRSSTAWTVLIDKKNGQPSAYLPLDGF